MDLEAIKKDHVAWFDIEQHIINDKDDCSTCYLIAEVERLKVENGSIREWRILLIAERDKLKADNEKLSGDAATLRGYINTYGETPTMTYSTMKRYRTMLGYILPLAKGYAAVHPVGANAEIIRDAERALKGGE